MGGRRLSAQDALWLAMDRPNNLMVQYVKAGRLGRKTGKGVYEYGEGA